MSEFPSPHNRKAKQKKALLNNIAIQKSKIRNLEFNEEWFDLGIVYKRLAEFHEKLDAQSFDSFNYYLLAARTFKKYIENHLELKFNTRICSADMTDSYNNAIRLSLKKKMCKTTVRICLEAGYTLREFSNILQAKSFARKAENYSENCEEKLRSYYLYIWLSIETENWDDVILYSEKAWMVSLKEKNKRSIEYSIIKDTEIITMLVLCQFPHIHHSQRHQKLFESYKLEKLEEEIDEKDDLPALTVEERMNLRILMICIKNGFLKEAQEVVPREDQIVQMNPLSLEYKKTEEDSKDLVKFYTPSSYFICTVILKKL